MPGSVESDQVLQLAGQSRKLMKEIADALHQTGVTLSGLSWTGSRLGRQWKNLGGERVVPYSSIVGTRSLTIDGTLRFWDDRGKLLDINDSTVFTEAMYISESRPSWKWQSKRKVAKKK
jgi:hypothetical protein